MKVLVTGANGFVGAAVIDRLKDAVDLTLVAGPRGHVAARHREQHWVQKDMAGSDSLDSLVRGQDAVIHLAGLAHVSRDGPGDSWDRFRAINVDATRRLAQAAAGEGVRRFILMSSGAINGVETFNRAFTEADPPNPASHYGLSKQLAEEALRSASQGTDMEWVAVRPPVLVGADTPGNIFTVMTVIQKGLPLPFRAINNRRSYLGLRNFTAFVALALDHPAAANQVFMLTDEPSLSTPELIRMLSRRMGRPSRLFPVPTGVIEAVAAASGKSSALKPLWATLELDPSKALALLGWRRDQPLSDAFDDAVAAFLSRHHRA